MIAAHRLQHVSAGGLALLVHGLLLAGLMVGVSWNNPPHLPVEAELWTELPALPAAALPEPAPVEALPLPLPPPLPLPSPPLPTQASSKPAEPTPKVDPAPVPDQAEIALKAAEKKRLIEAQRVKEKLFAEKQLAEKKLAEEQRQEELRLLEQQRLENERKEHLRLEHEKQEQEKAKARELQRQIDQEIARQMQADLAAEAAQLRSLQEGPQLRRREMLVKDFQEKIRNKIKNAIILPRNLRGDSEVTFKVNLLPNGEVARVTPVKSSGQPLYDNAVERAIYKASPLPLPAEKEAAAQFRSGLNLTFRPSEDNRGLQ